MVGLTPRHTYNASLGLVLRALAHMRAGGALLHAAEWRMYSAALQSGCICQRMAAVATVAGDAEEVGSSGTALYHVLWTVRIADKSSCTATMAMCQDMYSAALQNGNICQQMAAVATVAEMLKRLAAQAQHHAILAA